MPDQFLFGHYDVIDFVAVLFGYAVSSERTLEAFYQRLQPWGGAFMALFGRDQLPARSTLSRFLASLDQAAVEALRTLFLNNLLAHSLNKQELSGGMLDRQGKHFLVFDVDGTREAARQRALPKAADRPASSRRLRPLCAPGYTGRKRGEIVRTRTTVLQAHTHQWLGSFGNKGVVYELFWTNLPQQAFTARDVVELYLHRGRLNQHLLTKMQNLIPTAGALIHLAVRSAGRSSPNGSGISV